MACRCSGASGAEGCNCFLEPGPGIDVFGTGTSGDPYTITLTAAPTRWWDGEGPPDPEPEGSQAGDYYLDTTTGDVWLLAGDDTSGGAVLIGNIQGPTGPQGPAGPQGEQGEQGEQGDPGTGVSIEGSVPTEADLPTLGSGDAGTGYMTEDTGHLWVWDGTQWIDAGEIRGPQGETGPAGPPGQWTTPVVTVFDTDGDFTFDPTAYPSTGTALVEVWGAGGGGGGAGVTNATQCSASGGGGGGAYAAGWVPIADMAGPVTVTVGAGGNGGGGVGLGTNGGSSTFGGFVTAGGGSAPTEAGEPAATGIPLRGGGVRGQPGNGTHQHIGIPGEYGNAAIFVSNFNLVSSLGYGGASPRGGSGGTYTDADAGQSGFAGVKPGAGGSGGWNRYNGDPRSGGPGAPGGVVVTVYA